MLARLETCFCDALVEHARQCKTLAPSRGTTAAGLRLLRELAAERSTITARSNPYARLVRELPEAVGMSGLDQPDGHGAHLLRAMRPVLVTVFAYGVPSDDILARINTLAEGGRILEVGAGGGSWARCLSDRGATITAFDRVLPLDQVRPGGRLFQHYPVAVGGAAEAVAAVPHASLLLLCWPPGLVNRNETDAGSTPVYSSMGTEALDGFAGKRLVVVGDGGRSFGSPAFHERVASEWRLISRVPLPTLGRWRDEACLYERG